MPKLNHINIRYTTEGPAHDPYGVTTYFFTNLQGYTAKLVRGSLTGDRFYTEHDWLVPFATGEDAVTIFEIHTGLSIQRLEKIYHERFYFEDPMGSPGMYI